MADSITKTGGGVLLHATLWMGDLHPYMDETFISNSFSVLGENVVSVKLINNRTTGLLAGYCFVEFADAETAQRAMLRLNGKVVPGTIPPRRFKLNHASYGKEHLLVPEFSLFVGDLSDDVDDLALFSVFSQRYKSCRQAKVVIDVRGRSRGYGFVRFTDETDQQNALTEMQHCQAIGKKPIRVSLATPKMRHNQSSGSQQSQQPTYMQNYYQDSQYQNYYNNYGWSGQQTSQYYQCPPPGGSYSQYQLNQEMSGQSQTAGAETQEEDLQDPNEGDDDIAAANKKFMEQSEELFTALEGSRWHPMDSVMTPLPCKDQS